MSTTDQTAIANELATRVNLDGTETQAVLDANLLQQQAIIDVAQTTISTNQFVFFAAFDGTRNDATNDGNINTTNVKQLWDQYSANIGFNPNIDGDYFPGVVTKDTLFGSAANPTAQSIITAEKAYQKFVVKAREWLQATGNSPSLITAAFTSFSRGDAAAAMFSQLLY